jgi:hypothetical protein
MLVKADYAFTLGNCGGGSLRWSVRVDVGNDGNSANDGSVFIYYGAYPNFTDCNGSNSQSGQNMMGQPDLRYDPTQVGGTFYDTYAHTQTRVGNLPVVRVSLVIDSGWFEPPPVGTHGDQKLNISNVTVNDNTFVPLSGPPTQTCNLPVATIKVTKLSGDGAGPINEPVSVEPADNDSLQDC